MNPPNYNLLKYELYNMEHPKWQAHELYKKLVNKYVDHMDILYAWFESLSREQLTGIMVEVDGNIDSSEERNVGFMVREVDRRRYIVYRETFRGIRNYYSFWRLREV